METIKGINGLMVAKTHSVSHATVAAAAARRFLKIRIFCIHHALERSLLW